MPADQGRARPAGVVAGLDGSSAANAAAAWAADWAHHQGLPLRLVTAAPAVAHSAQVHAQLVHELHAVLVRGAAAATAQHPGLPISVDVLHHSPAAALVELSSQARLMVVGNRGAGGWADLLLGSVAADVAAHAHCVVVVCPERRPHRFDGRIVLGVDDGPQTQEAAEFAFRVAAQWSCPLTAAHVLDSDVGPFASSAHSLQPAAGRGPDGTGGGARLPDAVRATLAACAARHPDVTVEEITTTGRPAAVLSRLAQDAGLLVVGSRGRGGFAGLLLGSTSRDLLQAASCPVAVVRPGDLAGTRQDGCRRPSEGGTTPITRR